MTYIWILITLIGLIAGTILGFFAGTYTAFCAISKELRIQIQRDKDEDTMGLSLRLFAEHMIQKYLTGRSKKVRK